MVRMAEKPDQQQLSDNGSPPGLLSVRTGPLSLHTALSTHRSQYASPSLRTAITPHRERQRVGWGTSATMPVLMIAPHRHHSAPRASESRVGHFRNPSDVSFYPWHTLFQYEPISSTIPRADTHPISSRVSYLVSMLRHLAPRRYSWLCQNAEERAGDVSHSIRHGQAAPQSMPHETIPL